jgi:hypothetical protein
MKGITAYLKNGESETIHLVLDDVEATTSETPIDWKHIVPYTSSAFDAKSLADLSLSKEQYAEIGENLIIRLLALGGLSK